MSKKYFTVVLMFSLSLGVHARDWGFSKDTVYEWAPNGDNVNLMNLGTDTLKIDTISLEIIRPDMQECMASFEFSRPPGGNYYVYTFLYKKDQNIKPGGAAWTIAYNQIITIFNFEIDEPLHKPLLAKSSATAALGDTIVSRLIFFSQFNRGADTLILIGRWDNYPTGILGLTGPTKLSSGKRFFDLRGRVEKRPFLNRTFLNIPLLSPNQAAH